MNFAKFLRTPSFIEHPRATKLISDISNGPSDSSSRVAYLRCCFPQSIKSVSVQILAKQLRTAFPVQTCLTHHMNVKITLFSWWYFNTDLFHNGGFIFKYLNKCLTFPTTPLNSVTFPPSLIDILTNSNDKISQPGLIDIAILTRASCGRAFLDSELCHKLMTLLDAYRTWSKLILKVY